MRAGERVRVRKRPEVWHMGELRRTSGRENLPSHVAQNTDAAAMCTVSYLRHACVAMLSLRNPYAEVVCFLSGRGGGGTIRYAYPRTHQRDHLCTPAERDATGGARRWRGRTGTNQPHHDFHGAVGPGHLQVKVERVEDHALG